eukprot:11491372-Alexandrium_andersonii.AAC.1
MTANSQAISGGILESAGRSYADASFARSRPTPAAYPAYGLSDVLTPGWRSTAGEQSPCLGVRNLGRAWN